MLSDYKASGTQTRKLCMLPSSGAGLGRGAWAWAWAWRSVDWLVWLVGVGASLRSGHSRYESLEISICNSIEEVDVDVDYANRPTAGIRNRNKNAVQIQLHAISLHWINDICSIV